MLAPQPGSSIHIVLLLPDRDDLLDALDRISARLECGGAVSRSDANDDAGLAHRERADSVDDGDVGDSPTVPDLIADLRHAKLGGRRIRFVFEMRHGSTTAVVSHGPDERRDGPGT